MTLDFLHGQWMEVKGSEMGVVMIWVECEF